MRSGAGRSRHAATVVLACLVLSLLSGLFLPVYTDEVGWRFQLDRYVQDGGVDRFLAEHCGANTLARPPWFMLPVRLYGSLLTTMLADPAWVRLIGVTGALCVVGLLWLLVRRLHHDHDDDPDARVLGALMLFGLLGMGVLPLLLVWSRPEQPVLLYLLLALVVATAPRRAPDREPWGVLAALVALSLLAFSTHLKALAYTPFLLLLVWRSAPGHATKAARAIATIAIAGMAIVAAGYWRDRFACPADPILSAELRMQNIASGLTPFRWSALPWAAGWLLTDLDPRQYLQLIHPAPGYMSDWLPRQPLPKLLLVAWGATVFVAWFAGLVILAWTLWVTARLRWRHPTWQYAAALTACALIWAASQIHKNVYDASLTLPVLATAALLAAAGQPRWPRRLALAAVSIGALSLVSQALLAIIVTPAIARRITQPGYIADQPYSVSPYGYAAVRPVIERAAAVCRIDPVRARGVLVDDVTYFTFARSYRPLHWTGVFWPWQGSIRDPLAYLREKRSDGIVLGCRYLPTNLRARATATGDFCCLHL